MKKQFIWLVLLISVGLAMASCNSKGSKSPNDIEDEVIELLSDLNDMTPDEFQSKLASLEDYKTAIKNAKKNDTTLRIDSSMIDSKIELSKSTREKYLDLIKLGEKFDVKWDDLELISSKIAYPSNQYCMIGTIPIKRVFGEFEFTQNGKYYYFGSVSFYDGNRYILVTIHFDNKKGQGRAFPRSKQFEKSKL